MTRARGRHGANETPREIKKVRFIYHVPDGYEPVYVNGVHGGVTPRGDLVCNFFLEHQELPEEEQVEVQDGELKAETATFKRRITCAPSERVFVRDVRVGVIIPLHQVESIARWMLDKLKDYQSLQEVKDND